MYIRVHQFSKLLYFLVEMCGPKINEIDFGLGRPPATFIFYAIFEKVLNVKKLICCFSPKPSHVWYQIKGLDERNTLIAV